MPAATGSPESQDIKAERLRRRLHEFFPAAWQVLEPATPLAYGWHYDAISEHLQAVAARQITRLIINQPPRSGKSSLVTMAYPVWCWLRTPAKKFAFGSYSGSLSAEHSVKRRDLIQSMWFQQLFGGQLWLRADRNRSTDYSNNLGGQMFSTSVDGTTVGRGADDFIIDDPHNPRETLSDTMRKAACDWYQNTVITRLNDPKTGAIVLVMQRLHDGDLTGFLQELEPNKWTVLRLPNEAEGPETITYPITGRVHERADGELLNPDRLGPNETAALQLAMGAFNYSGQYQQKPTPAGGGFIHENWIRYWNPEHLEAVSTVGAGVNAHEETYRTPELPEKWDYDVESWDCSFKEAQGSDRVSGQHWITRGADFYLKWADTRIMGFNDTKNAILQMHMQAKANETLIEDKANGTAILEELRTVIPSLRAIEPMGSKEARCSATAPIFANGHVYLPDPEMPGYEWVREFVRELIGFNNARYDDIVDGMSQAVNFLKHIGGGYFGWLKAQKEKLDDAKLKDAEIRAARDKSGPLRFTQ